MNRILRYPAQGISILEILIIVSLMLVVMAFASPSLNRVHAKADLKAAVDQVESSILIARQTARRLNSDVIMRLHASKRDKQNSISLVVPALEKPHERLPQDTVLPEGIRLVTSQHTVVFDAQGAVEEPVYFSLVSMNDEAVTKRMLIQ